MAPRRVRRRKAMGLAALIGVAAWLAAFSLWPPSRSERRREILVPEGASVARVGRDLRQKGLIRSAVAFRLAARLIGGGPVKAGVYRLSPNMSTPRILRELRHGAQEQLVRLTFPEGFTLEQIAERSARLEGVRPDEFRLMARARGGEFSTSFHPPANLEGYLFPDTYEFRATASSRDVISTMLATFDRKVIRGLAGELADSARRGQSLHEIVIIASLIEREARVKSEQARVSSVIQNRLRIGMLLQIDATVQYVIGHRERLLYRDLEVDSPYNTYKVVGLPPGPICNPGLDAIRAALAPERTDYLYYTARADGSHVFTTTLQEHARATREARGG